MNIYFYLANLINWMLVYKVFYIQFEKSDYSNKLRVLEFEKKELEYTIFILLSISVLEITSLFY